LRRRLALLLVLVALGLCAVWVRVFTLQVTTRDKWMEEAERSRRRTVRVEARRGRILDADGQPLAEDRPCVQLAFVPAEWETRDRWRCLECGTTVFPRARGKSPAKCGTCGAKAARLEHVGPGDLRPLEDDLALPPGTLAREAAETIEGLERLVRASVERMEPEDSQVDDLERLLREDHFRRERTMTAFGEGSAKSILRPHLSDAALRRLALDAEGRYRGFRAVQGSDRWYPQGSLLAAMIGYTRPATDAQCEAWPRPREDAPPRVSHATRLGAIGQERFYESTLLGTPGLIEVERADDGGPGDRTVRIAPVAGLDVRLSLRVDACREAQRVLVAHADDRGYAPGGPSSGGFVVMDLDGAVLAWADTPTFDLNGDLGSIYQKMTEDEAERARAAPAPAPVADADRDDDDVSQRFTTRATPIPVAFSRVAQVPVEPGSSLKLVTALTLLLGEESLPEHYVCAGPSRSANDKPGCSHDHPAVGPEDAMAFSCNRYWAVLAGDPGRIGLHRELFPRIAGLLGLGQPTGIDLPRASRGTYPKEVDATELRFLAIGQGRVVATPLHMARICAGIANGGRVPRPRLAASVGGVDVRPEWVDLEANPRAIARVREGMRRVVEVDGGTAHRAYLAAKGLAGVSVFGKTGTAQVGGKGRKNDWNPDGIGDGPWHHWFVGYASKPGAKPIAFAMVLHARTEQAGGSTAAPAVLEFLAWWFGQGAAR
jgi:cell division protein FtsI/penicillin-binding protein 2